MIDKQTALKAHGHALKAITELSAVLKVVQGKFTESKYEHIKKTIGLSIGRIQTDILDVICKSYPELDDLKS